MQLPPLQPNIEINGRALSFTVSGFRLLPSVGLRFLQKYGLVGPDVEGRKPQFDLDAWYPQAKWLSCFAAIYKEVGASTIMEIGRQLGLNYPVPEQIKEIHGGLQWLDPGYHLAHRKQGKPMYDAVNGRMLEGIGHYGYERLDEREVRSLCDNPYPCDFDLGVLTGIAQRFAPRVRVAHDESSCRKRAGSSCTYHLRW